MSESRTEEPDVAEVVDECPLSETNVQRGKWHTVGKVGKVVLAVLFPLALMGIPAWLLLAPLHELQMSVMGGPDTAEMELIQTSSSPGGEWSVDIWYNTATLAVGRDTVWVSARPRGDRGPHYVLCLDAAEVGCYGYGDRVAIEWSSVTSVSVAGVAAEMPVWLAED